MKVLKFLAGAAGTAAMMIGTILIALSIGVVAWIGRADHVELPQIHVQTDDGVVVVDDVSILSDSEGLSLIDDYGSATITVRSDTGEDVFVGVADSAVVDGLLQDDPSRWDASRWAATDSGQTATVEFDLTRGDWSLVMVGPSSRSLALTVDAEVTTAPLRLAAGVVGSIGTAFALFGALLLWLGVRRRSTAPPAVALAT